MIKRILYLALLTLSSVLVHAQTPDSIAHTLLVANYDYTCHTTNVQGEDTKVQYALTLQVGPHMACTMGQKRHKGEDDKSEQILYVPTTWQNHPQGKMTSVETIPPYQYLTTEKMDEMQWALLPERDTLCGLPCQKATATYGGRAWTAWFAESLPTRFGPWRLHGLPGLILRAMSDDGIHHFECREVEPIKEAITYRVPEASIPCTRNKFVKLRNRIFGNPNYLKNPMYYIKTEEVEGITVMGGTLFLGRILVDTKPNKFQPLDY